jgi:predicted O-methyltransferase YrrM
MGMPSRRSFAVRAGVAWTAIGALTVATAVFAGTQVAAVMLATAVGVFTGVWLYRRLLKRLMTTLKDGRAFAERRTEALLALHELCHPPVALPFTRGWAASPDFMLEVILRAQHFEEPAILECGSGVSTVWLGLWLSRLGRGRLVSLEHDAGNAEYIRGLLALAGVSDRVEVVHTPLVGHMIGTTEWSWYQLDDVPVFPLDVLVVDGPPRTVHPLARFPAVPLLESRLSRQSLIFLHDTWRPGEQRALARWLSDHPQWQASEVETEKGAVVVATDPASSTPLGLSGRRFKQAAGADEA